MNRSIDRIRINPPSASLSRLVATRRSPPPARRASSRRRTSVGRARARRELSTWSRMDSTDRAPRRRERSSSLFAHTTMGRDPSRQADTKMRWSRLSQHSSPRAKMAIFYSWFSLDGGDWYLARRSLRVALDRFARWNVFFSGCDTHCSHGDASLFLARRFPRTLFLASLGIPEALCEGERHHGVLGECPRRKNVRILWARPLPYILSCR